MCIRDRSGAGDIEAVLAGCDVVIDHTYHTRACQQAMMETFRTYCSIDTYGRLNVLSSTQIVFHARRNISFDLYYGGKSALEALADGDEAKQQNVKKIKVDETTPCFRQTL